MYTPVFVAGVAVVGMKGEVIKVVMICGITAAMKQKLSVQDWMPLVCMLTSMCVG